MNFHPFPVLKTERLILREMRLSDALDLYEMRQDVRMHENTDTLPDQSIEETIKYLEKMKSGVQNNRWIIWSIEHEKTNKVIGSICIWNIDETLSTGELGYGIMPSFQGQGFMKEALLSVVHYGFHNLPLKSLEAYTEKNNITSIKLLETLHFIPIKIVIDPGYFKNRDFEMVVYELHQ